MLRSSAAFDQKFSRPIVIAQGPAQSSDRALRAGSLADWPTYAGVSPAKRRAAARSRCCRRRTMQTTAPAAGPAASAEASAGARPAPPRGRTRARSARMRNRGGGLDERRDQRPRSGRGRVPHLGQGGPLLAEPSTNEGGSRRQAATRPPRRSAHRSARLGLDRVDGDPGLKRAQRNSRCRRSVPPAHLARRPRPRFGQVPSKPLGGRSLPWPAINGVVSTGWMKRTPSRPGESRSLCCTSPRRHGITLPPSARSLRFSFFGRVGGQRTDRARDAAQIRRPGAPGNVGRRSR